MSERQTSFTAWLPNRKYALPSLIAAILVVMGLWALWKPGDPQRLLEQALSVLDERGTVERVAARLEAANSPDHAAYLRARLEQRDAERLTKGLVAKSRAQANYRQFAQAARAHAAVLAVASSSAGFVPGPMLELGEAIRPAGVAPPVQREFAESERQIRAHYLASLLQLQRISEESALRTEAGITAGECYFRLGQLQPASQAWEFVLTRRPEHADAHRHLASIYYDLGAMPRALRHLEELARLEPADGRPHRQIGLIWKDEKQSRPAMAAYQEALRRRLEPAARAEVVRELAELWLGEGEADYGQALAVLDQCPAEFANRPELLALRADALWKSRRDEAEARRLIAEALRRDPDHVEALLVRARMHMDEDEPAQALPYLERARRLAPHLLPIRVQLATAWQRLLQEFGGETGVPPTTRRRMSTMEALRQEFGGESGVRPALCFPQMALASGVLHAAREALVSPQAEAAMRARDEHQRRIEAISALGKEAMEKPWDDQLRVRLGKLWLELGNPLLARTWIEAALVCNPANVEAQATLRELQRR